jgi:hypothetical protein
VLAAGVASTVLVGCSSSDDGEAGPTLVTQPADRSPNGEDAEVRGIVRYDTDGDCVFLGSLDEETRMLPVWPHGYSARTKDDKVRILNGDRDVVAEEGDTIRTNGGFHALPPDAERCGVEPTTDAAAVLGEVGG